MISKWRKLILVSKWEFSHFFKWKQEIVSKLIMLAVGLFIFFMQGLSSPEVRTYRIGVYDGFKMVESYGPYEFIRGDADSLLGQLETHDLDGVLLRSEVENVNSANSSELSSQLSLLQKKLQKKYTLYTHGKNKWQQHFISALRQMASDYVALSLGLDDEKIQILQHPIQVDTQYLDQRVKSDSNNSSATAIGMLILILIGVFMSFGQIFVSITGEKQQRVTEQLYTCMEPQTWVDGKIIGQLLHSLKAMVSTGISMVLGLAFVQVFVRKQALDFSAIDFTLIPIFLLFAISGLYMITAFMAAFASAIDDPNHSGKSSFMMLPILPIIVCFFFSSSPSDSILTFLSLFPLTSYAAMPMKMSMVSVPLWQILTSLIGVIACSYWMRLAAGRMFKMGMVMYGKEPTFKDLFRWAIKSE